MLYQLHEFNRNLFNPLLAWSQTSAKMLSAPESWLSQLPGAARVAANYELLYRLGKDYEKPAFDIQSVQAHGDTVPIVEKVALAKPFCNLMQRIEAGEPSALETLNSVASNAINELASAARRAGLDLQPFAKPAKT